MSNFFVFFWQEATSEFANDDLGAEFGEVISEFDTGAAGANDEDGLGWTIERKCLGGGEAGG